MKAVRIHAFGGPEVIRYEEVPKPVPGENEVLFKVTSTSLNYADVQWRLGNYVERILPATLGREVENGPGIHPAAGAERRAAAARIGPCCSVCPARPW